MKRFLVLVLVSSLACLSAGCGSPSESPVEAAAPVGIAAFPSPGMAPPGIDDLRIGMPCDAALNVVRANTHGQQGGFDRLAGRLHHPVANLLNIIHALCSEGELVELRLAGPPSNHMNTGGMAMGQLEDLNRFLVQHLGRPTSSEAVSVPTSALPGLPALPLDSRLTHWATAHGLSVSSELRVLQGMDVYAAMTVQRDKAPDQF